MAVSSCTERESIIAPVPIATVSGKWPKMNSLMNASRGVPLCSECPLLAGIFEMATRACSRASMCAFSKGPRLTMRLIDAGMHNRTMELIYPDHRFPSLA